MLVINLWSKAYIYIKMNCLFEYIEILYALLLASLIQTMNIGLCDVNCKKMVRICERLWLCFCCYKS